MPITEALSSRLKSPGIIPAAGFINGNWVASVKSGKTFDVTNPATGEVLATLPDMGVEEVKTAIDAAFAAQKEWEKLTARERSTILKKADALIHQHVDDLATILTLENGKPFAEAKGEILYGASYVEWFAEEAKRVYGDTIPGYTRDKRITIIKQPIGVVGAITPWNFPFSMIARKMAPALAVGCTMVAKPAAQTPLSTIVLAAMLEMAGAPRGLFNVIVSKSSAAIGTELTTNEKVRKITFTGSTEVGRILMRQGADQIKKFGLELGGNAPFIVFDDADIDAAVEGAMISKYRNAGQTCVCANRLFVHSAVYDEFAEKLAAAVAKLKVGDGMEAETTIGPLIDAPSFDKVSEHVADAVAKGAKVLSGGKGDARGGLFFSPTILTNATPDMRVAREEIFGPVAPLFKFETVEEVIELANSTEFGLASYFYARDLSRVYRVAEALDFGMIGINTGHISTEVAPFGGVKQSGFGREGSKYGIDDYLEIKYLCMGNI